MNRHIRLAEQIRQEVGEILTRKVQDPGIGLLTLTRAVVSTDLLNVRVYYTTLGTLDDRKKTARALERAVPFIRRTLGERLSLRRVPELAFQFDDGAAAQARVEELLETIKREDAARTPPAPEPEDE